MVEHFDFQELAGAHEVAGDGNVGFGRGGVAAGVIVNENDGRGIGGHGVAKDVARVDDGGVKRAVGEMHFPNKPAPRVHEDGIKMFDLVGAAFFP